MRTECHVRLFKNGQSQALIIPKAFELPGSEAVITKEKDRLIIEPVKRPSLLSLLKTLESIDEDSPETNEGLLPLDDHTPASNKISVKEAYRPGIRD